MPLKKPYDRSYWAAPGKLLAGVYPGAEDAGEAEAKLSALLDVGIRAFVDLTEAGEGNWAGVGLVPYDDLLQRLAAERVTVTWRRFPIVDQGITTQALMRETVDYMDACIEAGQPVYVHCWGGKGRTGTAVGCWLIRHGLATPEDFVQVIADLRRNDPAGGLSPENPRQVEFVRTFAREEG